MQAFQALLLSEYFPQLLPFHPVGKIRYDYADVQTTYYFFNFFSNSCFTTCGLACPFISLITWPTKNMIIFSFPDWYSFISFGCPSSTATIADSNEPKSVFLLIIKFATF